MEKAPILPNQKNLTAAPEAYEVLNEAQVLAIVEFFKTLQLWEAANRAELTRLT